MRFTAQSLSVPGRYYGPDFRAAVTNIRAAGFERLELGWPSTQLDLLALSDSGRREVLRILSGAGLAIGSIRIDVGTDALAPSGDADQSLDRIDRLMNAAAGLGSPPVCLAIGRLPPAQRIVKVKPKVTADMAGLLILPPGITETAPDSDPPSDPPPVPTRTDPAVINHWKQALGQLGEIADRYAVMLALSSPLSSLMALEGMLKMVGCSWFGIDFDPVTAERDERSIEEILSDASRLIGHFHARDAVIGEGHRTRPAIVGRGDIAWRPLLELLDDAGYTGPITLDPGDLPDPAAAITAGAAQLRAYFESSS